MKPLIAHIEFEQMLLSRHSQSGSTREGTLEQSKYLLLSRISLEGPMSIGELSAAFGLDTSTVHRQTAAALADGLVERIPDPEGGMARKFQITATGEAALDHERGRRTQGLTRVLADWLPEDVAHFAGYLERFNIDIEKRSGRTWPRVAAHR